MLDWEGTGNKSSNGTLFNRSSLWFDEYPAEEEKLTEVEFGCHEGSKKCKVKVSRVIAPSWRERVDRRGIGTSQQVFGLHMEVLKVALDVGSHFSKQEISYQVPLVNKSRER